MSCVSVIRQALLTLFESLDLHLRHVDRWADDGLLGERNLKSAVGQARCVTSSQFGGQLDSVSVVFVVDQVDGDGLLGCVIDDLHI